MSDESIPPVLPPPPEEPSGPSKRDAFADFFTSPAISYPPAREGDRQWAVALHLSPLAGLIVPGLGHWIAPLAIWLIKRPESAYLDEVGKEVLNFQISFTVYTVVSWLIAFILSCLVVPYLLPMAVIVGWIALIVVASIRTSNGENYRYPVTIRLLK